MPLAILTIRKELHGFLFLCIRVVPFHIIMGLRLAALRAAGAPLESVQSLLAVKGLKDSSFKHNIGAIVRYSSGHGNIKFICSS